MNQNVSAAETSGVNEIVTQGEVLRQVLIRTVGRQDAQVMLVLKHNRDLGGRNDEMKIQEPEASLHRDKSLNREDFLARIFKRFHAEA